MKNATSTDSANENVFKTAQDVLRQPADAGAMAGFNRRIAGEGYAEAFQYPHERQDGAMVAGWSLADGMIREGKLFYQENFHRKPWTSEGCFGIRYGGSICCNGCGLSKLEREWWKVKVFMDGNAWVCIGTGFENLQESDNYAFGDTRDEAIENYGRLMLKAEKVAA